MNSLLQFLEIFLGSVSLLMTRFALFRLHQPTSLPMWLIKVFISALSPVLFLISMIIALAGYISGSLPAFVLGCTAALLYLIHIIALTRPPDRSTGFESALGKDWNSRISAKRKSGFLSWRYVLRLSAGSEPILKQDISIHSFPGTERRLLCDIWQPPKNIKPSGLAFIYLHGSAWTVLDKDYGTRPFFRHLASQGHVIMDLAYRLFPETDLMGMVYDAKRAIAWIKAHAGEYNVNPDRIIIGGGSAGAHIAMLAAYTVNDELFTPPGSESADLSVRGVISFYGQADLRATYYHTSQHLTAHSALTQHKKSGREGIPRWIQKNMGVDFHRLGFDKGTEPGRLVPILGGSPDEKPDTYALFSPINYINKDCPATLILHGSQDILAPVEAIRRLYTGLKDSGVSVMMHILPQTDHAFDLILPKISPSAQNAYYDIERFLAVMAFSNNGTALTKKVIILPFHGLDK